MNIRVAAYDITYLKDYLCIREREREREREEMERVGRLPHNYNPYPSFSMPCSPNEPRIHFTHVQVITGFSTLFLSFHFPSHGLSFINLFNQSRPLKTFNKMGTGTSAHIIGLQKLYLKTNLFSI